MTDRTVLLQRMGQDGSLLMGRDLQGEGNYDAAREYDRKVTAHAKDKAKVEAEAKDARKALDGPERAELEAAEAEGRSHAKS